MTPGPELDAAVLRILGWKFVEGFTNIHMTVPDKWVIPDEHTCRYLDYDFISTEPNGHEALRLCGPWLEEHAWRWSMETDASGTGVSFKMRIGEFGIALPRYDTRGEAIARLVLAVAEREGT